MAYRSAEGGYGAGASVFHLDASHPDYIVVPDADLLFHGTLRRAGPDLRLTGPDGRHHIIPDYFAGEKHPALVAPNGARLSADLVELLAGSPAPGQYAQANPTPPAGGIGKVEKVVGDVAVIRNGVSAALHVGDAVYKSDIIQTGADSKCGIAFPDGTAFNLVANTRLAVSDYSYDPNGTANNAAFSILQGTFGFVAGKVAHTGDMNIATPVATMGIRGTIGTGQQVDDTTWSFTVDDGVYVLLDANGNVLERVYRIGYHTIIHRESIGTYTVTTLQMTQAEQQLIQELVRDVIQDLNLFNNPNPQSNPNPGSSTPPDQLDHLQLLLNEDNGPPILVNVTIIYQGGTYTGGFNPGSTTTPPNGGSSSSSHDNTVIWTSLNGGNWNQGGNWNNGSSPGGVNNVDIPNTNPFGTTTVTVNDSEAASFLTIGPGAIVDVVGPHGFLAVFSGLDDAGTLEATGDPPSIAINGPVTVASTGKILSRGDGVLITMDGPVANDGVIAARHGGAIDIVGANSTVTNSGRIEARDQGNVSIDHSRVDNDSNGTIEADGYGSSIELDHDRIDNSGRIEAKDGGTIDLAYDTIRNRHGVIEVDSRGSTVDLYDSTVIDGTIEADGRGSMVDLYDSKIIGGTLSADGGAIFVDCGSSLLGSVNISIGDGGLVHFADVVNANAQQITVSFCGNGTLQFDQALSTATPLTISNFGAGDILDLTNLGYAATGEILCYDPEDRQLTLNDYAGGTSESFTLQGGPYTAYDFSLLRDPEGGTEIVYGTQDDWTSSSSGRWADPCNWSAGVPGEDNTAKIVTSGTYVTIDDAERVGNLVIGDGSEGGALKIVNGGLEVLGAVDVVNGTITVHSTDCDPYLRVDGFATIEGSGTITGIGDEAVVEFRSEVGNFGEIAAERGGTVRFDDSPVWNEGGTIKASYGGEVKFDHSVVDNASCGTIVAEHCGATVFEDATVTNESHGKIEAKDQGTVTFDGGTLENERHGDIEADGRGSTVELDHDQIDNSGLIEARDGATVDLDHDTIRNWHGTIAAVDYGTLELTDTTVHNDGAISITTGGRMLAKGTVTLDGSGDLQIANTGTLVASNGSTLQVDTAVTGGGNVLVEGGTVDFAQAANVGTITFNNGSGMPTYGEVSFGNEAGLNGLSATVNGFAGTAADAAGSDEIELAGVWTTSSSLTGNGGNLVVNLTHGSETATLTFANFGNALQISNNGTDTFIFDPPAANSSGANVSVTDDSFTFRHHDGAGASNSEFFGAHDFGQSTAAEIQQWPGGHDESTAATDFAQHADAAAHWHAATQNAFHLH